MINEERLLDLFRQVDKGIKNCTCNGCTVELKQAINVIQTIILEETKDEKQIKK